MARGGRAVGHSGSQPLVSKGGHTRTRRPPGAAAQLADLRRGGRIDQRSNPPARIDSQKAQLLKQDTPRPVSTAAGSASGMSFDTISPMSNLAAHAQRAWRKYKNAA